MPEEQSEAEDGELALSGRTIAGRYRIDALLGEGAMGAVYGGTQLGLDRRVAIKVLRPRHTDEPTVAKRFDREAIAISKLDHRNCVQVLDAGTTTDNLKYIVMEHLAGQELRALLTGPLAVARAVDLTMQILDGLEHAHRRGLVHRDLKPENVFVVSDDDGAEVVKIVDFGIVKLLDPTGTHEPLTRIGMVFGTPAYMAPEQAAGGKIDARTDLYGVGILLYEMLAGAPPFRADQPGIVLRQHMLAEPPPLPDTIPTPVREVVAKLLAKAAADRYATARDARDALQEAIASRAARSRGDLVFLPAITDEGEASPPPAEKPRRETWRGSAPLGDPQPQAGTPPRRTPTIRVDLGAAGSAAAPASTTDLAGILAKPAPPLPSSPLEPGRAAETSGALPVEAARAAETSGALPVAAATSGARPVDPAIAGAPMPSFGGSGTVRVTPNVEAHPQRPKGLGTKTTLLLLVLLVAAVAASLYASGAFAGPAKPRVEGGDG